MPNWRVRLATKAKRGFVPCAAGWAIARWRQTQLSTRCETANAMQLLPGFQSEAFPSLSVLLVTRCHCGLSPTIRWLVHKTLLWPLAIILEFCLTTDY